MLRRFEGGILIGIRTFLSVNLVLGGDLVDYVESCNERPPLRSPHRFYA